MLWSACRVCVDVRGRSAIVHPFPELKGLRLPVALAAMCRRIATRPNMRCRQISLHADLRALPELAGHRALPSLGRSSAQVPGVWRPLATAESTVLPGEGGRGSARRPVDGSDRSRKFSQFFFCELPEALAFHFCRAASAGARGDPGSRLC